jgi:hypothetical protein
MDARPSRFHEDFFVDLLFARIDEPQRCASDISRKSGRCVANRMLTLGGLEGAVSEAAANRKPRLFL